MDRINTIDTNLIKFEARTPPQPDSNTSKFWTFMQKVGLAGAPVAAATSIFFPPGLAIAAATYGMSQYGGYKNAVKAQEGMPVQSPAVFYPGINTPAGAPSAFRPTTPTLDPMNVIENRQAMQYDVVRQVE